MLPFLYALYALKVRGHLKFRKAVTEFCIVEYVVVTVPWQQFL